MPPFFTQSVPWLQILIILGALPTIRLFLGVAVCFLEGSAIDSVHIKGNWPRTLANVMAMGFYVALVLTLIGGAT